MNTAQFVSFLVLASVVTVDEADNLAEQLSGLQVPATWREQVEQIETILGRKLI